MTEQQENDDIVNKIQKEAKNVKNHIVAVRNGAFYCYHSEWRSIRGIVMVAVKRNAGFLARLTQLRLLFEEDVKVKTIS